MSEKFTDSLRALSADQVTEKLAAYCEKRLQMLTNPDMGGLRTAFHSLIMLKTEHAMDLIRVAAEKTACSNTDPRCPQSVPIEPYRMGQRVYDFNHDGLGHYGLLPDMLQDLRNLGDPDLEMMFRSAEGFLLMWERVERLRGPVGRRLDR